MSRTRHAVQRSDGINTDFGAVTTTPEQRHRARLAVATLVPRTGGTLDDLGDALEMLGLVDDQGRPLPPPWKPLRLDGPTRYGERRWMCHNHPELSRHHAHGARWDGPVPFAESIAGHFLRFHPRRELLPELSRIGDLSVADCNRVVRDHLWALTSVGSA